MTTQETVERGEMNNQTDTQSDIYEAVGTAERELTELESERDGLPAKIRQAAEAADATSLVRYRRRADEIGEYIQAAKVRLLRLRITAAEAHLLNTESKVDETEPDLEPAQLRYNEAQAELSRVRSLHAYAVSDRSSARQDLADRKRQLSDRMRELMTPLPPVVRTTVFQRPSE
jgi:chromosome segregation ATPase